MSPPVRVIKLGGSLLNWPELCAQFRRWLAAQPLAANVLIVGGGTLVEQLRELSRVQELPDDASHWLAIRAMSLSAGIVAAILPEARVLDSLGQIDGDPGSPPQILEVEPFLRSEQGRAESLPESWDVTSDSIAARVASVLEATELVLLKSTLPYGPLSIDCLARQGIVDAYFPRAARSLDVRLVNLRDPRFAEARVLPV